MGESLKPHRRGWAFRSLPIALGPNKPFYQSASKKHPRRLDENRRALFRTSLSAFRLTARRRICPDVFALATRSRRLSGRVEAESSDFLANHRRIAPAVRIRSAAYNPILPLGEIGFHGRFRILACL